MSIDLSAAFTIKIEEAINFAESRENIGQYREAAKYYRIAAQGYVDYARETRNEIVKRKRSDLARSYLQKSKVVENKTQQNLNNQIQGSELKKNNKATNNDNLDLQRQISSLVTKVDVSWSDIAGLEKVKSNIRTLFGIKLAQKPKKITLNINPNMFLYGPPGTGKTLLASAVSNSIGATFYCVNASNLVSKWLGESSRLIASLFEQARAQSPSVIFIDEFDSLVGNRDNSDSQSEARILGSILSELDGVNSKLDKDKFVIVIVATNVPWKMDKATLSRFTGGLVYVPLPDIEARKKIVELNIAGLGLKTDFSFENLARKTDGFSGREIKAICNNASHSMVDRLNPNIGLSVDGGLDKIRNYQLKIGSVSEKEFVEAIENVKPTANLVDIEKYKNWESSK